MKDKKTQWSTDEKARMVLQTFSPGASVAGPCRQHNLAPRTLYNWKERFLAGGRGSLEGSDAAALARSHRRGASSLKRIIGECAVANEALKKTLGGERERARRA